MLKKISLTAKLFLLLFLASCNNTNTEIRHASVLDRGELVVAMDLEMPGYFVYGGENYGYQYELFKSYAEYLGVDLRVVDNVTSAKGEELLSKGDVDVVTTLSEHVSHQEQTAALPIYSTSYVMLTSKAKAAEVRKISNFEIIPFLKEGRLLVSSGFKVSGAYDELLDSLPNGHIYVSPRNSFELIEMLSKGEYDYLVCEMSEAQLGCALVNNVEQIYTFAEPLTLSAVFATAASELRADFDSWLSRFRNGGDYAMLNYLYFEKGIVAQVIGNGQKDGQKGGSIKGGISVYDKIIKQICAKEGYDWRFVSAIIYSESRFDPNVVSNRGARGLMQVMPMVAKQFKVFETDLMKPENNILLGVKILGRIESSLNFPAKASPQDKMKIILACYNGGIGHVTDARNLARKYGGDANGWEDVSKYLSLKSDPLYASDEVVKCGAFESGQTLAFVNEVFSKYTAYCNSVKP